MSTPKTSKPKILITGANGLLGQKLVEQLVERGKFEVIATGKGHPDSLEKVLGIEVWTSPMRMK